ncbi:MAG TPA: hypothetical protein VKB79_19335 [Bryobacteraceae bacterium]|nr:hypothetical protein [Bryobacteraceae bacterium]
MTDAQLYFAIGLPVFAVLVNIIAGIIQTNSLGARFTSLESTVNARFTSIENRFTRLESRFEALIGKLNAIDNRLI